MAAEKHTIEIEMPEITMEIDTGRIICGGTVVEIKKDDGTFKLTHRQGYITNSTHKQWRDADLAARNYALQTERRRLIALRAGEL